MKVTIIAPSYNQGRYLEEQFYSVLEQKLTILNISYGWRKY